jgi:hypothetical protein
MTQIVVSKRDGILTAPDGTKTRVARGKTLADARHPAVEAHPRDWVPVELTLTVDEPPAGDFDTPLGIRHEQVVQLENDVAELEETLAQRDAELTRLADGLALAGIELPTEDDREPGWLVNLALGWIDIDRARMAAGLHSIDVDPATARPAIAPPKPRKRTVPPLTTRTGGDDV